jgi:urease alpha subunit
MEISRERYAELFGPTTGDPGLFQERVRESSN